MKGRSAGSIVLRVLLVMSAFATLGCTANHVQLKFHRLERGDEYDCEPTTTSVERCKPSAVLEPAEEHKAGTRYVIVPSACQGQFNQITIHDADSSSPKVHVICAPLEN